MLRMVNRRTNVKQPKRELSVPEQHQLKIARQTLKYNDVFVNVLGGMTKEEARNVIERLTGKKPKE